MLVKNIAIRDPRWTRDDSVPLRFSSMLRTKLWCNVAPEKCACATIPVGAQTRGYISHLTRIRAHWYRKSEDLPRPEPASMINHSLAFGSVIEFRSFSAILSCSRFARFRNCSKNISSLGPFNRHYNRNEDEEEEALNMDGHCIGKGEGWSVEVVCGHEKRRHWGKLMKMGSRDIMEVVNMTEGMGMGRPRWGIEAMEIQTLASNWACWNVWVGGRVGKPKDSSVLPWSSRRLEILFKRSCQIRGSGIDWGWGCGWSVCKGGDKWCLV